MSDTAADRPALGRAAPPGDEVETELHRRRRGRNLAVGGALLAVVLLIFTVTIVKLGANAVNPFYAITSPAAANLGGSQ